MLLHTSISGQAESDHQHADSYETPKKPRLASLKAKAIVPAPHLINAIYDLHTGEILLAHPTEYGVYVKPEQFKELYTKINSGTHTPVYTPQKVGSMWLHDPDSGRLICALEKSIRTCYYIHKTQP